MLYSNQIEQLSLLFPKAADFIASNEMANLPEGRYELSCGDYVNVESYTTKNRVDARYEAHREYIDIQMVLKGEELIEVCPIDSVKTVVAYDKNRDIEFYSNETDGDNYHMAPGAFLVLMPRDAHMPQVAINGCVPVKKAVFKIKLNKTPKDLQYLVMDVDGTLTDGSVSMGLSGELFKTFNIKDGLGIASLLPHFGIEPIIITGRNSQMLAQRCNELGISKLYQGISDKLGLLNKIVAEAGADLSTVCYIGDDLNDIECMKAVSSAGGFVACPQDSASEVKAIADVVLASPGGHGAVRELIDMF